MYLGTILVLYLGTILGVCMCRPPTQDTLITWLQYLQERYPVLKNTTVVYNVTVLDDLYHWYDTNNDRCISRTKPLSLSEN